MQERRHLVIAFLLFFGTFGIYVPYFPAYLKGRGIDGSLIGLLLAAGPLLRAVMPPVWGYAADRWRGPRFWTVLAAWAAVGGLGVLMATESRAGLFAGGLLYYAAIAPLIPLLDAATLSHLSTYSGRYGRIRLWGSVGFIVTSFALGTLFPSLPTAAIAGGLLAGHVLFAIYMTAAAGPQGSLAGAPAPREVGALLRTAPVLILLVALFFNRMAGAPFNGFYTLFVQDLGYSGRIVAWTWGIAVTIEVLVMYGVDRFIERIGTRRVLAAGFLLETLRWFAYATQPGAAMLLVLAPLHGIAFALLYVASVRQIAALVPDRLRATGQGLAAMATGFGQMTGMLVAGYAYDHWGNSTMFLIGGTVGVLATVAAVLSQPRAVNRSA